MNTRVAIRLVVVVCMVVFGFFLYPVPASAAGFSVIGFPGCDIVLSTGNPSTTITIPAGTMRITITQGSTTLRNDTHTVVSTTVASYRIPLSDFPKPVSQGLLVHIDVDGAAIADLGGQYPTACMAADLSWLPPYLRDGRVTPTAADRIAIWCNKDLQNVDIWGIDNSSNGFRLAIFTVNELTKAGPKGINRSAKAMGTIFASMDSQGTIFAAWKGGPYGANGQSVFAKVVSCQFS